MATVVTNLDTHKLDAMIRQLPAEASKIVRTTAFEVESEAKVRAPVDTGALVNSLHTEMITQSHARVADGVEYGIYQELGFHHWRSGAFIQNPFMIPAVEKARPNWFNRWRSLLSGGNI